MPSYPTTIVPSPNSNGLAGNTGGPFQAPNGKWYVCYPDLSTPFNIDVYGSSDLGGTWTKLDAAHHPTAQSLVCGAVTTMVGSTIWTTATDNVDVYLVPFDTSTDTWGSPIDTGLAYPTSQGFVLILGRPSGSGLTNPTVTIFSFTPTNVGPFTRNRCFYSVFDTVTLTAPAYTACGLTGSTDADCDIAAIVLGDGNSAQLFMQVFTHGSGVFTFTQQRLDPAGTLGTFSTFFTSTSATSLLANSAAGDGTNVIFSLIEISVNHKKVRVFTGTSADPVSFTETDLTPTAPPGITGTSASVCISAGVYFVFFSSTDGTDADNLFEVASDSGSGFGSITTIGSWPGSLILQSGPLPAASTDKWGVVGLDALSSEDETQFWSSASAVVRKNNFISLGSFALAQGKYIA